MSLLDYEQRFSKLRMNTRGGNEKSPHKVAMLLAVMDLIEREKISHNRIYFDDQLRDAFSHHFNQLAGSNDRNNPHLPFFHLRGDGFWHHYPKPGKVEAYNTLTTASGPGAIANHIAYAFVDDELFEYLDNSVSRNFLKSALLENLSGDARRNLLNVGDGWDWLECEAIVQDYFAMLNDELIGKPCSKAEHRRALVPKLNQRSEGSVEFKHQNISAILIELGQPYIKGYKPAFNYQHQLKQVVLSYLAAKPQELDLISESADLPVDNQPQVFDWGSVLDTEIPERITNVQEPRREYLARKVNYSERERNNRSLGLRGEEFALEFERYRLTQAGRADLAKEVKWVSRDEGDGLGYDIRSFSVEREDELFIEVKTTNSGKYQPFYISDNELAFSREYKQQYCLYRVYDFRANSRLFRLSGALEECVYLQATNYKASFSTQ
jgi:hypothetical protein